MYQQQVEEDVVVPGTRQMQAATDMDFAALYSSSLPLFAC